MIYGVRKFENEKITHHKALDMLTKSVSGCADTENILLFHYNFHINIGEAKHQ